MISARQDLLPGFLSPSLPPFLFHVRRTSLLPEIDVVPARPTTIPPLESLPERPYFTLSAQILGQQVNTPRLGHVVRAHGFGQFQLMECNSTRLPILARSRYQLTNF